MIVPIKRLSVAKTRLRGVLTTGSERDLETAHESLVLGMALDTVAAALASPVVGRVVVVCADPAPGEEAALLGAEVVMDVPDAGLNSALAYAAAQVRRTTADGLEPGVAALTADLPALRSEELSEALRRAEEVGLERSGRAAGSPLGPRVLARSFVADATGTGTVLLAAPPGALLEPCFGPDSAAAHEASGAVPLTGAWPGLRRDVDTPADLAEALALGVGPRTTAAYQGFAGAETPLDPATPG